MTLFAAGSLANIYAALDAYLTDHLVTIAGLSLRLHGIRRFIPPVDTPWIEAHYDLLGLQSQFLRQTGGALPSSQHPGYDEAVYGTERRGELQLNIYQRARFFLTRYTTAMARDRVVAAFPDSTLIPVTDSIGERPNDVVGNIITGDTTDAVLDTGLHSGVIQHVIHIQTRYIERYTRG